MLPGNETALLSLPTTTLSLVGTRDTHSSLHSFENISLILKGAVIRRTGLVLLSPSHLNKVGPHSQRGHKTSGPALRSPVHKPLPAQLQPHLPRPRTGAPDPPQMYEQGKTRNRLAQLPLQRAPAPGIRRFSLGSSHSPQNTELGRGGSSAGSLGAAEPPGLGAPLCTRGAALAEPGSQRAGPRSEHPQGAARHPGQSHGEGAGFSLMLCMFL